MVQGLAELNRNLQLVKTFVDANLITAMELSQNKVVTNAKSRHVVGSQLHGNRGKVIRMSDSIRGQQAWLTQLKLKRLRLLLMV